MTSSAPSGTPLQSPPLVFDPPSPGSWELERTHATKPLSRFISAIFPSAMMRGYRLRDERNFFSDALAVGVLRRATRISGERRLARGQGTRRPRSIWARFGSGRRNPGDALDESDLQCCAAAAWRARHRTRRRAQPCRDCRPRVWPAVVGCPAALEAIQSGVRLKVDGTTGEVRILG